MLQVDHAVCKVWGKRGEALLSPQGGLGLHWHFLEYPAKFTTPTSDMAAAVPVANVR
jgi:hypothetical protein